MKTNTPISLCTVIITFLVTGCGSTIKTGSSPEASGMRYFLPKSVIELKTTRTITTNTELKFIEDRVIPANLINQLQPFFKKNISDIGFFDQLHEMNQYAINQCFEVHISKTQKAELSSLTNSTVANQSKTYTISIDPSIWIDGKISINRTDKALLSSITIDTQGKADDAVIAGAKAIALIAGVMSGNPTSAIAIVSASGGYLPFVVPDDDSQGQKERPDTPQLSTEIESCKLYAKKTLEVSETEYSSLSAIQLLTLLSDRGAFTAIQHLKMFNANLNSLVTEIAKIERQLADAKGDQFIELTEKLKVHKTQKQDTQDIISALSADYSNRTESKKAKLRLGSNSKVANHQAIFDISQIPTFEQFVEMSDDPSRAGHFTKTLELFEENGFAITLDSLSTFSRCQQGSICEVSIEDEDKPYIAYRDPVTYVLNIAAIDLPDLPSTCKPLSSMFDTVACSLEPELQQTDPSTFAFSVKERKLVSVYPDDGLIGKIPYESSAWGDRKMELNFNSSGSLVTVNFDFTSSAESFANSALEASKGALSEYKSTIETVNAINQSKRQEEIAVIQQKIDLVNKSKEKLEAEIAMVGTEAGAESNLALQSINNQIQQLTAQQQLLAQQYAIESSNALNPINQQTSVAQAQLSLLQAQAGVNSFNSTNPWTMQQQQLNAQLATLQAQSTLNNFNSVQETASLQAQLETLKLQLQITQLMKEIEELKNGD